MPRAKPVRGVAPVSRLSIVIGRGLGAVTTATVQALWIGVLACIMGANIRLGDVLPALGFAVLLSVTAVGIGISFSPKMEDSFIVPPSVIFIMSQIMLGGWAVCM